ncbi:HTH_Tnp_Tc3_2 domain-containing protein [Trichonephila clavipes]|nr:HTH_Tnp_Tc3_2 domain-containing protein [Trichonephila clavipes]
MLVRLSRAPVLSGGLRRKTQLFSCTLYMAASSKTPPHQSKDPQKFKTPLQVPVFPGSSPLCHHTKRGEPPEGTTVPQIAAEFNAESATSVPVRTIQRNIIDMGFRSRRLTRAPLLTARHKALHLALARQHRHWTVDDWKHVAWSDESLF